MWYISNLIPWILRLELKSITFSNNTNLWLLVEFWSCMRSSLFRRSTYNSTDNVFMASTEIGARGIECGFFSHWIYNIRERRKFDYIRQIFFYYHIWQYKTDFLNYIIVVLGVHCDIYKSSYTISSLNSPPPSFSFILSSLSSWKFQYVLFFPFPYMTT
jgi:hypothetical protein